MEGKKEVGGRQAQSVEDYMREPSQQKRQSQTDEYKRKVCPHVF